MKMGKHKFYFYIQSYIEVEIEAESKREAHIEIYDSLDRYKDEINKNCVIGFIKEI